MSHEFRFKPRQALGFPPVMPPSKTGCIRAAVLFAIPGLHVGQKQQAAVEALFSRLGREVWPSPLKMSRSEDGKQVATIVAIGFHVPDADTPQPVAASTEDIAITLVERFLGMLSFLAGMRLVAAHTQTVTQEGDKVSVSLHPVGRAGDTSTPLEFPDNPFEGRTPSDNVFISLFWLRRALAERDPLDTFAAAMVSIQAIARELVPATPVARACPKCGHSITEDAGVSAMVRELVVRKLGAPPDLFVKLWKARSAVIAHGNQPVDAGTFLRLTELKFDAVALCYRAIKLALGLAPDGPPGPAPWFFATSALMYVE
jgi:hypothetical protein